MTFVLHRAERADVLADALADLLLEPADDAFTPEVVSVHSRGVERWLSHRLAARLGVSPGRSDGVCANLQFPFPGRMVGDALARATGVDRTTDPWRPEWLAWPLLDVVEANIGEPWLEVLTAHFGGVDPLTVDRDRRFDAVRHLTDLFDRYAVHRPAMILAWAAAVNEDGDGAPLPPDMAWQAELWRQVRDAVATPNPAERLMEGCTALVDNPELADLPSRLFRALNQPMRNIALARVMIEQGAAHRATFALCALEGNVAMWRQWRQVVNILGGVPGVRLAELPAEAVVAVLDDARRQELASRYNIRSTKQPGQP